MPVGGVDVSSKFLPSVDNPTKVSTAMCATVFEELDSALALMHSVRGDLLGLSSDAVANWSRSHSRSPVAVAIPMKDRQLKFVPRRHSPAGKRFELARFLGEYLRSSTRETCWLASTDLGTSRQKYQRAFAAEFLSPIDGLTSFLDGDFSSYAIEEAAEEFDVSEQTVTSLLLNNGYIHHNWTDSMPYKMIA